MSMTDPIADFLARIRNAILARHAEVLAPSSKLKQRLCDLLKDEGYIAGYDVRDRDVAGMPEIVVRLRWADPAHQRDHRPAPPLAPRAADVRRHGTIPKVRSGLGIAILSTSKGLMTDRAARKEGLGGELLCEVW